METGPLARPPLGFGTSARPPACGRLWCAHGLTVIGKICHPAYGATGPPAIHSGISTPEARWHACVSAQFAYLVRTRGAAKSVTAWIAETSRSDKEGDVPNPLANPTLVLELTLVGIAFGALYSLAALGIVLIYKTTGVLNF